MTGRTLEWRWHQLPDENDSGQRVCNLCGTGTVVNDPPGAATDLIRCLNCGASAPADTKPTPRSAEWRAPDKEDIGMSGPARTAMVTVEVTFRITDTATEGEMVDAAICSVNNARPTLMSAGGSSTVCGVTAKITTKATGGHL